MPSPPHEAYQRQVRAWLHDHAHEPDVVAQLVRHQQAALVLWTLDLEPARPVLAQGYAPNPRGGKPKDPVMMLRGLLLMLLVGQPSINRWVEDLRASRVLQVLAGLDPDAADCPGVGTFYGFLHRVHDGPIRNTCQHTERPSERERRRSRSPQPTRRNRKKKAKEAKPTGRMKRREKGGAAAATKESASARVAKELEAARELDNPNDYPPVHHPGHRRRHGVRRARAPGGPGPHRRRRRREPPGHRSLEVRQEDLRALQVRAL